MALNDMNCPACGTLVASHGLRVGKDVVCQECGRTFPMPKAMVEAAWYYARDKQKLGPVPFAELQRLATVGQVLPVDMVLRAGTKHWQPANSVDGLFPKTSSSAAALPQHAQRAAAPPAFSPSVIAVSPPQVGVARGVSPAAIEPTRHALWKRVLGETGAVCLAPITQSARLIGYVRSQWRIRAIRREDHFARLALGQRVYETGGGDAQGRGRIAALDEEIGRAEAARAATRALRTERDLAALALAHHALSHNAPPRGIETALERARNAGRALEGQSRRLGSAHAELFPSGWGDGVRLLGGATAVVLLVVLLVMILLPGRQASEAGNTATAPPFITAATQEEDLAGAVGLVVCGFRSTGLDDGGISESATSTGSCFAVSAEGHLLTNKHVVEQMWKLLHSSDAKERRETIRKVARRDLQPMVWVFFGKERHEAAILHVSDEYDFAILKVERHRVPFFSLSAVDKVARGSKVFAYGFPGAAQVSVSDQEIRERMIRAQTGKKVQDFFTARDFEFSVVGGIVSRIYSEQAGRRWIQHDAPTNPGNSGGPLTSGERVVLGIQTMGVTGAPGVLNALAVAQLKPEIEKQVPGVVWK